MITNLFRPIFVLFFAIVLLLDVAPLHAQATDFTYQGYFTDGASPATGVFDFQFELYDAEAAGTQLGILTQEDVLVADGIFTVTLAFDSNAFDGNDRWLQIGVRAGVETGAYTLLAPRVALTPVPHAIYGRDADADPANELNSDLSLSGAVLSLTDGGGTHSVDLASLNDDPRTPISAIPYTIRQPGSYYLTDNLTVANRDGITIDADNVSLDLNGYALEGMGTGFHAGIYIDPDGRWRNNIHIKNGTIRNWGVGIDARFADMTIFENLHLDQNGEYGLDNGARHSAIVINCTASDNGRGLAMGNGAIVKNSTAAGNHVGAGIDVDLGALSIGNASVGNKEGFDSIQGTVMVNNVARENASIGFDLVGSLAHDNSAYANGSNGFNIGSASHIMGNTAKSNGFVYAEEGYRVSSSAYLLDNIAAQNSASGILVRNTRTFVQGNHSFGNGENGILGSAPWSLFIGNSAAGNTGADFDLVDTSAYGQILSGTATTDQPFANGAD